MGYFAMWFLFTFFLLFPPFYVNCQIIDFICKYNKKSIIKCFKLIIIYPFKINSNKKMKEIYFKEKVKNDIRYVSRECFVFQIINYIYLLLTFIIMILKVMFHTNNQIDNIYQSIIKIDCIYFILLNIFFIFSYARVKKHN